MLNPATTTSSSALLLLSAAAAASAAMGVDLNWHAPAAGAINNLTSALQATGTYGFVFNSSRTPEGQYGAYNWCNMPHVRRTEYVRPPQEEGYELRYVEVIQRHHKRTPYAANAFPVEPYRWDCDDQGLFYFGQSVVPDANSDNKSAQTYWKGTNSSVNPFVPAGWIGSCQFPQITTGGLDDSRTHGEDLYGVYHSLLDFLPSREAEGGDAWRRHVVYRVTNNQITSQVAGQLIAGMWGADAAARPVPLLIQAAGVDSLEPQYGCPAGAAAFNRLKSSADARWQQHLDAARALYAALDAVSGVPPADAGFHASFDHYYDNLSARQCHADKPLPCSPQGPGDCVGQDLADTVYRLGQWEYSHMYRDAGPVALRASVAAYGVWVAELAAHLRAVAAGEQGDVRYFHNVAHDGSMSRVLAILQIDAMVWPGMGSELVFEVYRKKKTATTGDNASQSAHYVRVLFGGQPLKSSNPSLGLMDMLPIETLLAYFDGLVGQNASLIKGKCDGSIPL
ncbi:phosphoglycerate mutase-like protein [Apiospora kogelbergensis]|uniref:Phosphoglycerate mutase-like protein n=1 Tax=Apiospora kogelbergensis TaxID=1337665 RepID=A0AAW0R6B9_9PEZI